MRQTIPSNVLRVSALCAVIFFFSLLAAAVTIVLKNGRRIVAMSVVEDGDKVRYLTSAGELSLPKSIVDHIEKNGFSPDSGSGAASLAMTAPAPELRPSAGGGDEIAHN